LTPVFQDVLTNNQAEQFNSPSYKLLEWIFYVFCIVLWMPRVTQVGETGIGISAMCLAAMCPLLFFVAKLPNRDANAARLRNFLFVCIGLLAIWGYVCVYDVPNPIRSGRLFLSLLQATLIIVIISQVLSREALINAFRLLVAGLVISVLLSLLSQFVGPIGDLVYRGSDRSSGLLKNPNQYGMVLSMSVSIAALLTGFGWRRLFSGTMLIAILCGLALSGSKTNIVIGLLLMSLSLCYSFLASRRYLTLLIITPLIGAVVLYFGIPILEYINPRAASILVEYVEPGDGGDGVKSIDQRKQLWSYSIDTIINKPFFGEGTSQHIVVYGQTHTHSHNVFLDYGRTMGVPALMLILLMVFSILFFVVSTLLTMVRDRPTDADAMFNRALVVGCGFTVVSYVLSNQMSDSFGPSTSCFFWMAVGVLIRREDIIFGGRESEQTHSGTDDEIEIHPMMGVDVGDKPGQSFHP